MKAAASIAGHPIHPMLIALPVGLWVFSVIADIVYLWRGNPAAETVALGCLIGGCLGAVLAAVFGLIDLLGITDKRTFRVGLYHAACTATSLIIFAASLYFRAYIAGIATSRTPFVLSVIGLIVFSVGGWLGGELVFKHKAGVVTEAEYEA